MKSLFSEFFSGYELILALILWYKWAALKLSIVNYMFSFSCPLETIFGCALWTTIENGYSSLQKTQLIPKFSQKQAAIQECYLGSFTRVNCKWIKKMLWVRSWLHTVLPLDPTW